MSQAVLVELPDPLYQQLEQAAKLFRQPIAKIVEQSLQHSLPPILEDVPPEYQADVFPLLEMSDSELQVEGRKVFDPHLWTEYEIFLEKKKHSVLTKGEHSRLEKLRRQADVLTLRKGYALVLLKRRGYQLPPRHQLPASQ